ncbi:MAG: hypothetical protein V9G24_15185 [Rhodoblastus sp.]
MLVAEIALRRLKLDRLWLLVTPGNPLKDTNGLPPLEARIDAARKLVRDRAHRRHRDRGRDRHALHLRHCGLADTARAFLAFRLGDGRGQSAPVLALAALGRHCRRSRRSRRSIRPGSSLASL